MFNAKEMEFYTPEADPRIFYSSFMQMLSGGNADFEALSVLIDQYASRSSMGMKAKTTR